MRITVANTTLSRGLITLGAAAAVTLALAGPLEAQASRTRPGGSGSSTSSGGGSSASSGRSSGSSSSPSAPIRVERTRPSSGSGSGPTVVEGDRRSARDRGDRGDHHHHGGYYGSYGAYGYGYDWYPYAGWGWGWGWGPTWSWWLGYGHSPNPYGYYGPGYYGPDYGRVAVYSGRVRPSMGAIDTDVWPAKAEVYVDGQYVGVVDNFDGFPRYLWLDEGVYDVAFYKPGFITLSRQITIRPGLVIDVEDRLQPGEAVRPEDLVSTSTKRRDERLAARDRQRREGVSRGGDEGWRERVRAERGEPAERAEGAQRAEAGAYPRRGDAPAGGRVADRSLDARGEPGRLRLDVRPADAAVYLDGRFLGTGDELGRRESGVLVDPGTHKLSVVRPGHTAESLDFEIGAGDEIELDFALERAAG